MGTPPTSCYIIWTCDSALDNNRPFQPNHFVPLFVYSEKERTGNVYGNHETWKSETPHKTEKAKEKECPSTSKWIAENNVQPVPFYGKKTNETNTAERVQPTAENPLAKKCVREEELPEGTYAVETPSVEKFAKEEEGEGEFVVETLCVEECSDEESQEEETSAVETPSVEKFVREEHTQGSTTKETPAAEKCNEEQQEEGTSAVETPSVEEFVKAEDAEGSTARETPSVEEFVNEEVKGGESSAVKTPSMEE